MSPNPKKAFGDAKPPLGYVPSSAIIGLGVAFGEGADKYGPFNWRESPVEAMTYVHALLRHAMMYVDGEDVDPESTRGKTHLDGIMACAAILKDATELGNLIDNRPPKGPAPRLLRAPPNYDKSPKPGRYKAMPPRVNSGYPDSIVDDVLESRGSTITRYEEVKQPDPTAFTHCEGCHSMVCEQTATCMEPLMTRG